ncbi:MAG: bifunctional phosphoribosylaminoimidazolecarboxamide formyltransferase/IMP cyclohydrolase, partial [Candidatus Thermoplasmatota archaeon]|nr:bifunctional phosphoribosylaminoimidazolecarboxamide formyltransferase/IMP cyclohydrolase [Candidatus Thermoplasmatota archaeon]
MVSKTALISVFDKTDIVAFSQKLVDLGFQLISTGGTAASLSKAGLSLIEVSELTGVPEMLDGRVKTLHPVIHAGILARRDNKTHMDVLAEHHIKSIDIVVCNLYPFERTITDPQISLEDVVENIDIGGPTLIRAAAKNYRDVIVITNSGRYDEIITMLTSSKNLPETYRQQLAVEAFSHTAQYDAIISQYFSQRWNFPRFQKNITITMRKFQDMRYGENPHQQAAFYQSLPPTTEPCITNVLQLHGKELSFNNILDADCAIECIKEFNDPTCVIIKHATPCGIASAKNDLVQTWKNAYETDEYSPFGGIVAFNRTLTADVAEELSSYFLEVIIAPKYQDDAKTILKKKKNLRLLELPGLDTIISRSGLNIRSVVGGFLLQDRDVYFKDPTTWKIVSTTQPTKKQLATMVFAVKCVKHVKSNSVLFAKDTRTVAIGGGQTSRVDATWIATHKGNKAIKGSVMASDA